MQMLSKMVHGLPSISSTKGVCECCGLGNHHNEMFDKGKAWGAKETLQLIHSDICAPLETPYLSHVVYFLNFIDDCNHKYWGFFLIIKVKPLVYFNILNPWLKKNLIKVLRP